MCQQRLPLLLQARFTHASKARFWQEEVGSKFRTNELQREVGGGGGTERQTETETDRQAGRDRKRDRETSQRDKDREKKTQRQTDR